MLEVLFVFGFVVVLLITGVSLMGVVVALVIATVLMLLGGLLSIVIKLLPWLLLVVVLVWCWRTWLKPQMRRY